MSDLRMRRFAEGEPSRLEKAMNVISDRTGHRKTAGMAVPTVFSRFPEARQALESGTQAFTILLMVDLSPFSNIVQSWDASLVQRFLERYYRLAVQCIVQANGVVEKYIGDAVLAAFGAPFEPSSTKERLQAVIGAAGNIADYVMREFHGEVTAKSAITCGTCFFGYAGPEAHRELTIIGTPLTELFRLEDKCPPQSVVIPSQWFEQTKNLWDIRDNWQWQLIGSKPRWDIGFDTLSLRGVAGITPVTVLKRINHDG